MVLADEFRIVALESLQFSLTGRKHRAQQFAMNSPSVRWVSMPRLHADVISDCNTDEARKGMIMQSDNSHHEAHQNDLNYSSEYQYDMYMYAEYGIEW